MPQGEGAVSGMVSGIFRKFDRRANKVGTLNNAKMHQIRISAGAPPHTPLGELTALPSPDPLAAFKGVLL